MAVMGGMAALGGYGGAASYDHMNKAAAAVAPDTPAAVTPDIAARDKLRDRRYKLLVILRALKGSVIGAAGVGLGSAVQEGGMTGGQGALAGLIGGGLAGAGLGAAEGAAKRAVGMDPLLKTTATA